MATPRKIKCVVEKLIDWGEHVYTVELKPETSVPRFAAGQFLHLALDPYDPSSFWPESRVFSIASSARQAERLRISYSVHGAYTSRMEAELHEGGEVWVKLPYGDFVIKNDADVVLFAGGTGISAYTAFIEGLEPDYSHNVVLVYGARSEQLLLHREEILLRSDELPFFDAFLYAEGGVAGAERIREGRLSLEAAWSELRAPLEKHYYLSGPPAMIAALREQLLAKSIKASSIHVDAWE